MWSLICGGLANVAMISEMIHGEETRGVQLIQVMKLANIKSSQFPYSNHPFLPSCFDFDPVS